MPLHRLLTLCRLEPFAPFYKKRYAKYADWVKTIDETEGGMDKFSRGWQGESGLVSSFVYSPVLSLVWC